ncbi:hypothetical protein FRC12_015765 [Ceratobasidium sp. 428]|nr:hypothetical protein FRC12_015765 [Ceratobasidium sp. 428]
MLVQYLRELDDLPGSRILSLFDGKDPQNVPKASALLTNLHRASQLSTVTSCAQNKPFVLLGEVLGSFVHPFTVPTMSLAAQIASLAKCGHLLFALYRIDGAKFLPGQLYYDIQTSIKSAVFCVAKTQLVDRSLPFYLLQTGTDRLEARFGTYRTATSDRNGSLLQMCQRAASAQHIDQIFAAHPSWNRTPYRLSLDGRSGVDHTNPLSWIGDVVVGNVDLHKSWLDGQSQAAAVLTQAGVPFQFSTDSPGIDLMRPSGRYPGVQIDNIEPDLEPIPLSELATGEMMSNASRSDSAASDFADTDPSDTPQCPGNALFDIESLLPAVSDNLPVEDTEHGWVLIDNKPVRLEIAIRHLLGARGTAKSTDRLRRVCGFTRYLHPGDDTSSALGDYFHVSELISTFVRTNEQVALAIIRVTNITANNGRTLESISEENFRDPGITLSGQLLELEYDSETWYWSQRYDTAADTATSAHRKRHTGFDFDARFCRPVNPALVERNGDRVWAFEHDQMKTLMDELWVVCAETSPEDNIPACRSSATFPYRTPSDGIVLVHLGATKAVQDAVRPTHGTCFECDECVSFKQMRIHVGRHLLASRTGDRDVPTNNLIKSLPCGFCGRYDTCLTSVERQHKEANLVIQRLPVPQNRTLAQTGRWNAPHIYAIHASRPLSAVANEALNKSEPSDDEYTHMRVDRGTGAIQVRSRRAKRQRESEPSKSGVSEPSASRQRRT